MAKILVVFSPILLLVFLIVMSEIARANGELCERESQTYSGLICHVHRCDRKCIGWEKAVHGACHIRDWKVTCYCYFETCANTPPPPSSSAGGGGGGGGSGGAGGGGGNDSKQGDGCGKEAK